MPSLSLHPESTALVLIDLQNGIVGLPLAPYTGAEVVARSSRLATALRERGATIVYVRVAIGELLHLPSDAPTRDPNAPLPPASASELVADLNLQPGDITINKRQWGAFYGTELDQLLRRRGIRTLVMGGVATNFGVESTARAAFDKGYELVFAEDAMTTIHPDLHRFAITTIFPRMGRVRVTQEILEALPK